MFPVLSWWISCIQATTWHITTFHQYLANIINTILVSKYQKDFFIFLQVGKCCRKRDIILFIHNDPPNMWHEASWKPHSIIETSHYKATKKSILYQTRHYRHKHTEVLIKNSSFIDIHLNSIDKKQYSKFPC